MSTCAITKPNRDTLKASIKLNANTVLIVTRSHKFTDRDHAGLADGSTLPQEQLPKFFAKNGYDGVDPSKVKKNGSGKGNWGAPGDELDDDAYTMANKPRRRSNSSSTKSIHDMKTKFEMTEVEPVFEEDVHGPRPEDTMAMPELDKQSTMDSNSTGSVEEEEAAGIEKK